jgi:hypothetical protein
MEFFKKLREKSQSKLMEDIQERSKEVITLTDFGSSLYIAYNGTSLVEIDKSWASERIIQELSKLRQNYINSNMNSNHGVAVL